MQQPERVAGEWSREGVYVNRFGRAGKVLHSDILIKNGLLSSIGQHNVLPESCRAAKNYLVTDSICDALYADKAMRSLSDAGIKVSKLVVPSAIDQSDESSTEPAKVRETFNSLVDEILSQGISKHSCIISLGGGVINNMCGMIAATLYRGIALVHITTTTMGAFDAAIDFKQAINHPLGKNLLGVYYPASKIVIDPETFTTLSPRHALNGIAEALKHGLAQSTELVDAIVTPLRLHGSAKLSDPSYLEAVCRACIETKVPTLTWYQDSDFNEMVPQYGHAIAHAIEHLSWHPEEMQSSQPIAPLLHGEAVAIGMCISAEVALLMGLCNEECVAQHYEHVQATGLPAHVPRGMSVDAILAKMQYDKHHVGVPTMGLCSSVGQMARLSSDSPSYAWKVPTSIIEKATRRNLALRDVPSAGLLCLKSEAKNYDWGKLGSESLVGQLAAAGPGNPEIPAERPFSELWMGTHPGGPSKVLLPSSQQWVPLAEWAQPLGVPFLFKVLSVQKALSIQAHPDKELAALLHKRHPDQYKDSNHKPEMAVAVTPFEALCSFQPVDCILSNLQTTPELVAVVGDESVQTLAEAYHRTQGRARASTQDGSSGKTLVALALKALFCRLMNATSDVVERCLSQAVTRIESTAPERRMELDSIALRLYAQYPGDVGVFCVYLLNYKKLQPGEALFMAANEPHAYIYGECVEVMATSDNVLRAGLTSKWKDVESLCECLTYNDGVPQTVEPFWDPMQLNVSRYVAPATEFMLDRILIDKEQSASLSPCYGFSILIVVSGSAHAEPFSAGSDVLNPQLRTKQLLLKGAVQLVPPNVGISFIGVDSNTLVFRAASNEVRNQPN